MRMTLDESSTAGTSPADRRAWRFVHSPRTWTGALVLFGVLVLPVARRPMGADDSIVASLALLTLFSTSLVSVLLLGRFLADGSRQRLAAGSVFAVTSTSMAVYVLAFPGVLLDGTIIGSGGTDVVWISGLVHALFAVGLAVSGLPMLDGSVPASARRRALLIAVIPVSIVFTLLAVAILLGEARLPQAMNGRDYTQYSTGVGLIALLLSLSAMIAAQFARGPLQRHISPMVTAATVDLGLFVYAGSRYSFGWYAGRVVWLIAIGGLLVSLLADTVRAYRRAELRADDMTRIAMTDELTGLLNRRGMFHAFDELPGTEPYRMAIIDVDRFKSVNDAYGHDIGDLLLTTIAARLQHQLRRGDVLGRWGGDEFVLFAVAGDHGGDQMLERLVTALAADPLRVAGISVPTSVSIGAAIVSPGDDFDDAFIRADRQLQLAKRGGRNRVSQGSDGR